MQGGVEAIGWLRRCIVHERSRESVEGKHEAAIYRIMPRMTV